MSFIIAIRNVGFSSGARVFAAARAALKKRTMGSAQRAVLPPKEGAIGRGDNIPILTLS
jgi:hypothetical protein